MTAQKNHATAAQAKAPRPILGTFSKEVWGGRKGNDAITVGTEEFDGTSAVLAMPLGMLRELEDGSDATDAIGEQFVRWDGPHSVRIVDSVCAFFGVSDVEDITEEMVAFKCGEYAGLRASDALVCDLVDAGLFANPIVTRPGESLLTQVNAARSGLDCAPASLKEMAGSFAWAAPASALIDVDLRTLLPAYEIPEEVGAWKWLKENASYAHVENGQVEGVLEFVLNLARDFPSVPEELADLIAQARARGLDYVIFHQGC